MIKEKINKLIERIIRLFGKKHMYSVYVGDTLYMAVEDSRCPSEWRGSGCYDIDYYQNVYYKIFVVCKTESQAKEIVMDYIRNPKSFGKYCPRNEFHGPEIIGIKHEDDDVKLEPFGLYDYEYSGEDDDAWRRKEYDFDLSEAMEYFD